MRLKRTAVIGAATIALGGGLLAASPAMAETTSANVATVAAGERGKRHDHRRDNCFYKHVRSATKHTSYSKTFIVCRDHHKYRHHHGHHHGHHKHHLYAY